MNILLIGGTGVLSSAVAKEALVRGFKISMINRGNHLNSLPGNVELLKADKDDIDLISHLLEGHSFDAVIDFLCYNEEEIELSYKLYSNYANQYFFISSCAVYDTSNPGVCSEESPKILPIWQYSVEKVKSEELLVRLSKEIDTPYTIIRPCITYGDTRIPYGISPRYGYHWTLVARVLAEKPLIRWNGGVNRCNMMRVEDFATGVIGLMGEERAFNQAFNICGDETPSFNDVLECLEQLLDKKIRIIDISSDFYAEEVPSKRGEILGGRSIDSINSNAKLKSVLPNFRQIIFLKKGIELTLKAYKENNYQNGIDWTYDGDTDRIIRKWCKLNNIPTYDLNLHFVDYLGNAPIVEKCRYYIERNKKNICVMTMLFFLRIIRKCLSLMRDLFK